MAPNEASVVQLHIAEYQALTTRGSYWLVLQISLLPVVPIYLGLAAQVLQSGLLVKEVVVWVTVAGLELIGIVWAQIMLEHYTAVKYIEFYLRPMVENLVDSKMFWGYEPHLVKHRPISQRFADASIPLLGLIVFGITLTIRFRDFSRWDIGGVILNLMLLWLLWKQNQVAQRVRREWSASTTELAQRLEHVHTTRMESAD
jgi:hypothetical protein